MPAPPHGLMFHHFHDAVHPPIQGSISAEGFCELLDFVGRSRILPAEDWRCRAESGRLRDGELCLTFDDNLRCQYDIALPVLEAYGLTAFWFVYTSPLEGVAETLEVHRHYRNTAFADVDEFYAAFFAALATSPWGAEAEAALAGFDPAGYLAELAFYSDADRRFRFARDRILGPERYDETMVVMMRRSGYDVADAATRLWMGAGDLRRLASGGHVIGLHSHSHPTDLKALPADAQAREYARNAEVLRAEVGVAADSMAHPTNSYGPETLALLHRQGVRLGFRANLALAEYGPLEHPRRDHAEVMAAMHLAA